MDLNLIYKIQHKKQYKAWRKPMQNKLNRVAVAMHFLANFNYNWFLVPFWTFHPAACLRSQRY